MRVWLEFPVMLLQANVWSPNAHANGMPKIATSIDLLFLGNNPDLDLSEFAGHTLASEDHATTPSLAFQTNLMWFGLADQFDSRIIQPFLCLIWLTGEVHPHGFLYSSSKTSNFRCTVVSRNQNEYTFPTNFG